MDSIRDLLDVFIFDTCDKIIFCDVDDNAVETIIDDEEEAKDLAYRLDYDGYCFASFEVDANRNALVINYNHGDE